jgi:hypothetical protein
MIRSTMYLLSINSNRDVIRDFKCGWFCIRDFLAKSLLEKGHIQVKFKTFTNPGLKIEPNAWTRRTNLHMSYDYSRLNAYLFHFEVWRKPLNFVRPPKKGQPPKRYPLGTDEWWFDLSLAASQNLKVFFIPQNEIGRH